MMAVNTTKDEIDKPTDAPPGDTEDNAEWKDSQSDEPAKMTPIHEEEGADVTTDDEETNENDAEWKDNNSREPADESPTADGNVATTIGEFDKPTDEPATKSPAIDRGAANNTLEEIDELPDEQLVHEPDDGGGADTTMEEINVVADEVKTEDAAPTQPREGLHRSKGVTVLCGWAIHGIFCCCSGETVKLPMASNGKVQCVLPIRTMKSTEIEQEEYDEFFDFDMAINWVEIKDRSRRRRRRGGGAAAT